MANYSFSTHGRLGGEKSEAMLQREYKESRERLKQGTELVIARQKERAEDDARKAKEGEIHYDPQRKTTWHATTTREFEVCTSSGEKESMQLKVWTTTDMRSERRSSGFKLPFGRRRHSLKKGDKKVTPLHEFKIGVDCFCLTFSPDSRRIAFVNALGETSGRKR